MQTHQERRRCSRTRGALGHRKTPLAGLVTWTLVLAGCLTGLHELGRGALSSPPLLHPGQWATWAGQRGPITVAFALGRIVAQVVAAYLLLTTLGGVVARMAGLARAARLLERVSVPVVRRLLAALASASLASAASAGALTEAAWAAPAAHAAPAPKAAPSDWAIPTMAVATGPRSRTGAQAGSPAARLCRAPTAPPRPPSTPPESWTIAPGQNLWSVAAITLQCHWDRAPTDGEIETYWRGLIATNRPRLAHADAPDLVFAGQVFLLPPIAPTPPR